MNFDAKVQHILPDSKYPQGRKEGRIRDHFDNPFIAKVLHTSAVGMGFIPVLPTTSKIRSKYTAAARVGINPTPTVAECCNHFDNPLITKVLHTSAVGMGFIPVLPTYMSNNSLIL